MKLTNKEVMTPYKTPFIIAVECGYTDIVKRILDTKILSDEFIIKTLLNCVRDKETNKIILKYLDSNITKNLAKKYDINPKLKKSLIYDLIYLKIGN